jgi:hypothetical protein
MYLAGELKVSVARTLLALNLFSVIATNPEWTHVEHVDSVGIL